MKEYLKIEIEVASEEDAEILIADLAETAFYAFEQEEGRLFAFIEKEAFDEQEFRTTMAGHRPFKITSIMEENWNRMWEQNFEPVVLKNFAAVRADFHEPIKDVIHEIIITPKMSFGTGHHPTTLMMMELMSLMSFEGRTVIDFGTGTGVLAILAEKCGAASVVAIDNDPWSIENTQENIVRNNCTKINVFLAESIGSLEASDVVLANINLNVLTGNTAVLSKRVSKGGHLLMSGFLINDIDKIRNVFLSAGFKENHVLTQKEWGAISLLKESES